MKNSMKKISASLIIGTFVLGGLGSANAQTFNTSYKNNPVQTSDYNKLINSYKNKFNIKFDKLPSNNKNNCPTIDNKPVQKPADKPVERPMEKPVEKPSTGNGNNDNNITPPQNNQGQNQGNVGNVSSIESEVVRLVNVERSKQGLAPLKMSAELSNVARKKSQDMADKNYFSHTSPTYGSPFDMMKQFGIKYTSAGENIAKGQRSAQEVMNAWMNSSGHKANILSSNFGTIGVGYVEKNGTTYWTQMFTN